MNADKRRYELFVLSVFIGVHRRPTMILSQLLTVAAPPQSGWRPLLAVRRDRLELDRFVARRLQLHRFGLRLDRFEEIPIVRRSRFHVFPRQQPSGWPLTKPLPQPLPFSASSAPLLSSLRKPLRNPLILRGSTVA